ncbi:MAG: hypothetical protein WCJ80_09635 [Bacteroidota bacterium]|jgi:hypothetical protein
MLTMSVSSLEITQIVFDRMNVWIKCPHLKKMNLRYHILNTSNATIRKGSFMGECIQLNLFHLPEGKYLFNLLNEHGAELALPFVKSANQ